eukprot:995484-Pelagomonas_calceolata.AAC.1
MRCAMAFITSDNNTGKHGRTTKSLLNLKFKTLGATCSGASTHLTIPPPSSPNNYPTCSVLNNTSASTSALDITFQGATYLLSSILP